MCSSHASGRLHNPDETRGSAARRLLLQSHCWMRIVIHDRPLCLTKNILTSKSHLVESYPRGYKGRLCFPRRNQWKEPPLSKNKKKRTRVHVDTFFISQARLHFPTTMAAALSGASERTMDQTFQPPLLFWASQFFLKISLLPVQIIWESRRGGCVLCCASLSAHKLRRWKLFFYLLDGRRRRRRRSFIPV
jgi:hypothetical protein